MKRPLTAGHSAGQPPATQRVLRSYSMRQRFDVVCGVLLILIAVGSSLALELTRHQRHQTILLNALHEQERLVYELTTLGSSTRTDPSERSIITAEQMREFRDGLERLAHNLQTLQAGGSLQLGNGEVLRVPPAHGRLLTQNLNDALTLIEPYRLRAQAFNDLLPRRAPSSVQAFLALQQAFIRQSHELRLCIRGVAGTAESQSLSWVVHASQWQLAAILGGILLFLVGVLLLRRLVTTPLHRMVDGIEAMQRTGRLVKLPVMHVNELGVVAAAFNQLAEQVEEQKQRLREHIVELQRVNRELDELAHMKDDFLMTINHQLRTPMTTMFEAIRLLHDGSLGQLNEEQRSFVGTLAENATRLNGLIEDVLDLSLLKSGRRPLTRQPADVAALLRHAHTRWQSAVAARSVQLRCDELPTVYMDAQAIGEVVDHLVRNALRHAPERSEIQIEAHSHNGLVEVAVRDEGPGMSDEQVAKLFQPFVHVQTPEAPGSQGNGLGLAFCRQVIERHRGTIRAASAQPRGMTVTFTLPIASPQFLLDEACRDAFEEARYEHGQFGLLVVSSGRSGVSETMMNQAEAVLRRNTHRGDHFIRLDEATLAIVAVTDRMGLDAMETRLRGVLSRASLQAHLTHAVFPLDGDEPHRLLEAAQQRLSNQQSSPIPVGAVAITSPRRTHASR